MLKLIQTKRTEENLLEAMKVHYSRPKGFVGRNICYAIYFDSVYYGHIVAGSATLNLPGRNEFFGLTDKKQLNSIANNVFFHIEKVNGSYPIRNFSQAILKEFINILPLDWYKKYGDKLLGVETLVEPPRTGELYRRFGFVQTGVTKGFTCKRVAGNEKGTFTGKRVWNYSQLRPKIVFCYSLDTAKNTL